MFDIGVDIGGTNIAAGLVDENHRIVSRNSVRFPFGESGEKVAQLIAHKIRGLVKDMGAAYADIKSIGLAVPGQLDSACETVLNAYNLGFKDVPLRRLVMELFPDIPVFLANDANAAALAELFGGAFTGCKTAVLLTIGTGVGGGLILGGRMFNGGNNCGVELGHMTLKLDGESCTCGQRGCIEAECSATALIREGRRAASAHPESLLNKPGELDARRVIEAAGAGDTAARAVFDRFVDALSSAIASIVDLIDPEVVALGGGVAGAGEFLLEPLRSRVQEKCFFVKYLGRIEQARMGNDAGIIGAAMLRRNAGQ